MNQQTILGIGILVILIGIIILIIGSIFNFNKAENNEGKRENKTESKIAVVGFFGPIPFGFGNDKEMLKFGLVIGGIILIFIILSLRLKMI